MHIFNKNCFLVIATLFLLSQSKIVKCQEETQTENTPEASSDASASDIDSPEASDYDTSDNSEAIETNNGNSEDENGSTSLDSSQILASDTSEPDTDGSGSSEDDESVTESNFSQETTTQEPVTDSPPILQELDFKMSSIVGGFDIDVNFTEIYGVTDEVTMLVKVVTTENSDIIKDICSGNVGIYIVDASSCAVVDFSQPINAYKIADINKPSGEMTTTVPDLNIPFLLSHNCLIVAKQKSTDPITTTLASEAEDETTIVPSNVDSSGTGEENDGTEPPETTENSDADVTEGRYLRQLRQLKKKLGEAGIGFNDEEAIEKHQYDVKKVAEQVNNELNSYKNVADVSNDLSDDDEGSLSPDYYDPEDITDDENLKTEYTRRDVDIARALGMDEPGVDDDEDADVGFGLDKRTLSKFRESGCTNKKVLERISLLTVQPRQLTRFLFGSSSFTVYSSGSVFVPTIVTSSSGTVTTFNVGNIASFSFNPLANWPIVVLQQSATQIAFAVIIIWALILGAIVWGVSWAQFSGLFSVARAGYEVAEVVFKPLNRLTNMVHSGIERFSNLNRRNQRPYRKSSTTYNHRSNAFESDFDYQQFENYQEATY